jgi:hypothetical protein
MPISRMTTRQKKMFGYLLGFRVSIRSMELGMRVGDLPKNVAKLHGLSHSEQGSESQNIERREDEQEVHCHNHGGSVTEAQAKHKSWG